VPGTAAALPLQVPLVLAPGDTEALAPLYGDALDLVASTSLGPAAIRGAALSTREERALKWTQGELEPALRARALPDSPAHSLTRQSKQPGRR
jgi:hypothetical protein